MDSIGLAVQHTKRQLVQPFRFWQWTRLAVVGLLAGEMGSNLPSRLFNFPQQSHPPGAGGFPKIDPLILVGIVLVLLTTAIVFVLVMSYISSVMRFILFDSVLTKECHIRQGWNQRQGPGWRYFLWQVAFGMVMFAGLTVFLGIPALFAFAAGWFTAPREHMLGLVLGGILLFFVLAVFFVTAGVVHVLTKDFVVPQMAFEGIGAFEGWRRLWPMIGAEMGAYAAYVGMKIALAIGAAIVIGIASAILMLIVAIPTALFGILAVLTGKSAGLTWNASTITLAVVVGCILFALFMYLIALISVPAIVFFPAYAMYFFAGRYQALSVALYPPPPPAPMMGNFGGPSPLPPPPAPIG